MSLPSGLLRPSQALASRTCCAQGSCSVPGLPSLAPPHSPVSASFIESFAPTMDGLH